MTAWCTTLALSGVKSAMAERSNRMFSSFFQTLQKDEANLQSRAPLTSQPVSTRLQLTKDIMGNVVTELSTMTVQLDLGT